MRERAVQPGRAASVAIGTEAGADGQVLVLTGDLDVRSTGEVRAAVYDHLRRIEAGEDGRLVVDISRVASVDATALKVIATASREARRRGSRLVLRGACPAVLRMLHLTHLIRLIDVERSSAAV